MCIRSVAIWHPQTVALPAHAMSKWQFVFCQAIKRTDSELDLKVIMTAWSSYQEFLGLGARLGLPWTMKLGHDSKWVKYVDLRPAQNAASLIPWSWRSKHYQAMPVLWFVRLQSLLVSVKPSIRYCQPVSINKLWKCPEIINVHWRISWQFYLLIIDLLQKS